MRSKQVMIALSIVSVVLLSAFLETAQAEGRATSAPEGATERQPGEIDTARSRIYVFVGKTGLGHEHAVMGKVRSGSLRLDESKNAGSIVFDMATFIADTPEARKFVGLKGETSQNTREQVNANMRGSGVLNVAKHPTATFKINSALPREKNANGEKAVYQLEGSFTLHDVTRPLRINIVAEELNGKLRVRGNFPIKQTDFGITPFSKGFGAVGVTDELKIWGDIWVSVD